MCGRFTYRLTWPELVRLYRLTLDTPARNIQPRYNICATTNIDTVIERDGRAASLSLPETSRRGRDVMAITKMRFCEGSRRGLARSRIAVRRCARYAAGAASVASGAAASAALAAAWGNPFWVDSILPDADRGCPRG